METVIIEVAGILWWFIFFALVGSILGVLTYFLVSLSALG